MASLDEAISTECDVLVDTELAYDLFWAGLITDKKAFRCPGEGCGAQITCANLDKDRQDMRQCLNFRCYSGHTDQCDATVDAEQKSGAGSASCNDDQPIAKNESIPDEFMLKRPVDQFAFRRDEKKSPFGMSVKSDVKNRRGKPAHRSRSKYYSVRSLVSKYIRYRKEESAGEHRVAIGQNELTYAELFKGVYKQAIEKIPDRKFVYWGIAFIDFLEQKRCYKISFAETLFCDGEFLRPSFFIHESVIDKYPIKALVIKRLKNVVSQNDRRAFVFIYSKPYAVEKEGRKYINFEFENLDHVEVRYLDLFEDLKGTKGHSN